MTAAMEIVAADIGGTNARFVLATIDENKAVRLGEPYTAPTAGHGGLESAWAAYAAHLGRPLPAAASIAVAGNEREDVLYLTNGDWAIRPAELSTTLGLERLLILNDFGAVAHAVAQLGEDAFTHLCGPDLPLPTQGVISVIGPGTGLGAAQLLRVDSHHHVIETESGHIGFAPLDEVETRIRERLAGRYGRVSVERIVAGPALDDIYAALGGTPPADDRALWTAAMNGTDPLAAEALERFCLSLGSVAGDLALAHGAVAVVVGGGLGLRLAGHLPRSGFHERFLAKGRFRPRMEAMPVKLITHPQPGLLGAAVAFAEKYQA